MKKLLLLMLCFLFMILHFFLAPAISFFNIVPDFFMIFLGLACVYSPAVLFLGMSLFLGIAYDLTITGDAGVNIIIYFVAAAAMLVFKFLYKNRTLVSSIISVAGGMIIKYFILMFALYIMAIESGVSIMVVIANLPSVIYTSLIAAGLYFAFRFLFDFRFFDSKKNKNRMFLD